MNDKTQYQCLYANSPSDGNPVICIILIVREYIFLKVLLSMYRGNQQ